jgi:hypothetical protein
VVSRFKNPIFLFLLLSSQGFSFEVTREKDQIFLNAPTCSEVEELTLALATWTVNEGIHKKCPVELKPQMGLFTSQKCSFNITNCVPEHVATYQGVRPSEMGPNCWNLALVLKGILPELRYSTKEEMAFYMKPPLCRQLQKDEPRKAGDIGAIRKWDRNQKVEAHAFIYISEKIVYSKNGFSNVFPYELQSFKDLYKAYEIRDGNICHFDERGLTSTCGDTTEYFRCKSMSEYLSEQPRMPEILIDSFNKIGNFEQCLEKRVMNGMALPQIAQKNIIHTTQALVKYLNDQSKLDDRSLGMEREQRNFILGSLQLRLKGIAEQLDSANEDKLESEISSLADAVKDSVLNLRDAR